MSALELLGITKSYGEGAALVEAVRGVDLTVEGGDLVAIMGPSGSGKSTLLTIAGGLEEPSEGQVLVDGADLTAMSANQRAQLRRRSIGYVFQDFNLLPGLTAAENVALPLELDGLAARKARVAGLAALEELGLGERGDQFPDELSGGERQRVAIARALVGERRLLLADEPSGALDSVNGEAVMRLVRAACERGVAGVIVTHDAQLASWADRVVFLRDGRITDRTAPPPGPETLLAPGPSAMTAVLERPSPAPSRPRGGGAPARRAVARWSWRMFRREWRQHVLVLILLTVAVAGTVGGLTVATNTQAPPATTFTLPGSDPHLASDLAAFRHLDRDADIQMHRQVRVRGLANPVDLRAQTSPGAPTATLRLRAGHEPTRADEVALTRGLADLLGLHLGSTWNADGADRRIVGLVENPTDLNDDFALVAPGQADPPDGVTVRMPSSGRVDSFRLSSGTPLDVQTLSSSARAGAAVGVLIIATLGMLFVGLMAVAGFTVLAHRRLRALGMLASVGATNRHVRLVMIVDGLAVGVTAAVLGAAIALAGWLTFAPDLETIAAHRIDRFALPWVGIGVAMVLAVVTAVAAAWWPARSVARIPVVAALSGRPPRPQPAHRFAVAGVVTAAVGLGLLASAGERNLFCIAVGIPLTVIGVLLLAPVTLAAVSRLGPRLRLAPRLGVRDLARHQARSGAALGAVTLALGLAAVITITTTDAQATAASQLGNLPANEVMVYLSPYGFGGPAVTTSAAEEAAAARTVQAIASAVGARDVIPLAEAASNGGPNALAGGSGGPDGPPPASLVRITPRGRKGIEEDLIAPLYVATPQVLAAYGIDPATIGTDTDVLSSLPGGSGVKLDPDAADGRPVTPVIQKERLPRHSSEPNSLITMAAVQRNHLRVQAAAWLLRASHPITASQRAAAEHLAGDANLPVESRQTQASLDQLRTDATAAGVLLALGVLAMTVGLVRSEGANDLRTLTAAGASSTTRRSLTAATAGLLALIGAVSGTVAAYVALAAWYHRDLHHLTHVPAVELLIIVGGLPLVAAVGGWLFAGRAPSAIARRPLD